jgi:hypothetical protein
MFGGSFNLATIWSAEVDGLAMRAAPVVRPTGCKALFLPFERVVETRV